MVWTVRPVRCFVTPVFGAMTSEKPIYSNPENWSKNTSAHASA